jgi:hypothetical protein
VVTASGRHCDDPDRKVDASRFEPSISASAPV